MARWKLTPAFHLPRPAVSARSANADPNVLLCRENVPSAESYVYANPPDDDPSGIATYSQAGAQFGYGLLWTMLLTFQALKPL